jgi:hypothetical protein
MTAVISYLTDESLERVAIGSLPTSKDVPEPNAPPPGVMVAVIANIPIGATGMPLIGSATGFGNAETLLLTTGFAKTFLGGPANDITDTFGGETTGEDGCATDGVTGLCVIGCATGGAVTVCVCPFTDGCWTVGTSEGK